MLPQTYELDINEKPEPTFLEEGASYLHECIDPSTFMLVAPGRAASSLAYCAMWQVKKLLEQEEVDGDVGTLLRLIGEHTLDLAYDWAAQFEDGAYNYS